MPKPPRHGACVLIRQDGLILSISRGDDRSDWGLPGGGIDPGETPREAAARELLEETGVLVDEGDLELVFEGQGRRGYCWTFEPTPGASLLWPNRLESTPFEGHVEWAAPDRLTATTSRHRAYAMELLSSVG